MKRLIIAAGVLALSGCVADELAQYRGLPASIMHSAMSTCVNANSELDRIYIRDASATNVYDVVEQPDGTNVTVATSVMQYTITVRCFNNAKFSKLYDIERKETDYISSTVSSEQNAY